MIRELMDALISGIPKDLVFGFAFAISAVMVGFGVILLAPKYFVSPLGGWNILVKAWVITALGGWAAFAAVCMRPLSWELWKPLWVGSSGLPGLCLPGLQCCCSR